MTDEASTTARIGTTTRPAHDPAGDEAPIRVVLSDDHPVVRQGLRSFLEARGFAVVGEAGDGAEAVRVVEATRPDVLLTDLVMPGVDGIEAIRRLRAAGRPLGILVLTSFSGADQVIPAIRAGADGYLLKDARPRRARGRHPRRPAGRADARTRGRRGGHGPRGRGDRRARRRPPPPTTPTSPG